MQTIISTYIQEVSTIHPDFILDVNFNYKAIVHKNEEVDVIEVYNCIDGDITFLNIDKGTPSIEKFLATIREDARKKAYEQRKKNPSK